AFVYFRLETLNTAMVGALIAMVLVLVLGGFVLFRRTAEHIERLSTALSGVEEGKPEGLHEAAQTRELAIIADSFNRTLVKLEENAKELGLRALQMATLNKIREIASRSIRLDEVAGTILERVAGVMEAGAGYLAVKQDASPVLNIEAAFGLTEPISDTINSAALKKADGRFFDRPSPVLVEDTGKDTRLEILNIFSPAFPRVLYLPIVAKGTSIGLIALARDKTQKPFRDEDAQFLQTMLQQVAYSVENARLYEDLHQSNTELRIAMDSQKKSQGQLLASARMAAFGDLSVNIAHELNNPLTGILGYTDLILGSSLKEAEKNEYLKEIRSQAIRAGQITKSLLDFISSKPGSKIQTDLNALVVKSLSLIKGRILDHGIRLDLRLADDLPFVIIDPAQMGQVFFNLLSNALNAMTGTYKSFSGMYEKKSKTEGKPHLLRIETGKKRGKVYVAFRDTGPGIAPEDLPRIFEPFYSTQDKASQVGLGLWVAQRTADAHGGFIRVKSDPKTGSTFAVVLPLTEKD
ncbi:MAG: GAF domain-containing protein, partial [Deltaproteobacteria bacterium]|nr:GAF domain-containing protein [Deltaproteobacteria bacterium]